MIKNTMIITALSILSFFPSSVFAESLNEAHALKHQAIEGIYSRSFNANGLNKTKKNQMNYDFALNVTLIQSGPSIMETHQSLITNMVRLNFSDVRFNSVNVGGQDTYRLYQIPLGTVDGIDEKQNVWAHFVASLAVVGALDLMGAKEYNPIPFTCYLSRCPHKLK